MHGILFLKSRTFGFFFPRGQVIFGFHKTEDNKYRFSLKIIFGKE